MRNAGKSGLLRLWLPVVGTVLVGSVAYLAAADVSARSTVQNPSTPKFFEQNIAPLLGRCAACHGGAAPQAGLDLTSREGAIRGGKSGPALQPGEAGKSLVYSMTAARLMPPGEPLTESEIAILREWIDGGARWEKSLGMDAPARDKPARAGPDWWSLQPIGRPRLPVVKNEAWAENPVDRFVLARLEQEGLEPSPPAGRATLIRRLSFDLLGLPPEPGEVEAFVHDASADAYERLVDRLLASPHYGERWGRHWLDLARFAESQGYERDKIRDHAWHYRDYVVRAFNSDKPYDLFVKEQLAGDVLQPVTRDGIVATGFLVAAPFDEVGHQQQSKIMRQRVREEEMEDVVGVVAQTFLGMTANCARCHDHKFDPIPQRDYYRIKAAFDGVWHGDRPLLTPLDEKAREDLLRPIRQRIRELEATVSEMENRARDGILARRGLTRDASLPQAIARWTFDVDAKDSAGALHGALSEGAEIYGGRAHFCDGRGAIVTPALGQDLREKTFEAWLALTDPERTGAVLRVENAKALGVADAAVYGGESGHKWRNSSEYGHRTQDADALEETAKPGELIHLAVVYQSDDRIAIYRNGKVYQEPYLSEVKGPEGKLQTFPAGDSKVVIGGGFVEIDEARLYNRALTAEEVARSFEAGAPSVALEELLGEMTAADRERRGQFVAELERRRKELGGAPAVPLVYAANSRAPQPAHVLGRGDPALPGEPVEAGGLSEVRALPSEFGLETDAPEGQRRLRFAEWAVDPRHPLTARVMVNRIWHYHFGSGLVATPNDFGFNGERPSHPELLDWLASEFVSQGWSIKKLQKVILLANTYRQSSGQQGRAAEIDPDNRLLWRFGARRLEAEVIRDAMLASSGQLALQMGGPGFRPFNVRIFNSHFYDLFDAEGVEFDRRTLYRISVRSARDPLLETFDCPDGSDKAPKRSITTTPIQSLSLMNNSLVMRLSRRLAERVARDGLFEGGGEGVPAQIERAYRLTLGRGPTMPEAERALAHVEKHGMESLAWALFNSSEFLYLN